MTTGQEGQKPENPIEQNVFTLSELMGEKSRDLREKIGSIESLGILYSPQDSLVQLSMLRMRTQEALEKLPRKQEEIVGIIRRYKIETEIDEVFVRDLLTITERHAATPQGQRDEIFFQQESDVILNVLANLQARKAKEQDEKSKEQEFDVEISEGRVFKFFLSENTKKVRMELPLLVDPNKQQIKIGPEAVVEILGAKLSLEDYKRIAETMLSFRGNVGMICRAYAQAVDTWADLYSANLDASNAGWTRSMRAQDIRNIFSGQDIKLVPYADIPLNALSTYVMKVHNLIDTEKIPQPFEN